MNTVVTTEFDPHTDHIWGYRSGLGYIFTYTSDRPYRNPR